jgi:hypothetical protein
MWTELSHWCSSTGWSWQQKRRVDPDLVIYFGSRDALRGGRPYAELRAAYPGAHIIGASSTRSMMGEDLDETDAVAVAIGFARTRIRLVQQSLSHPTESCAVGEAMGGALAGDGLAAVFVLADGLRVNGSGLVAGLNRSVGAGVPVVGGMASDPCDYAETLVGADDEPRSGLVAAVGFYGEAVRLGIGSAHGWDAFGPRRRISRSSGNVLFELDGGPAFELYRRYLGEEIDGDPGAGVIFPLLVSPLERPEHAVVRAPIAVDKASGSITFAGDVPEGWYARLMRGNLDRLSLAAADAARQACGGSPADGEGDRLALVISCAGRYLLMGQRTGEELEAVAAELGPGVKRLGFYSYGEIVPTSPGESEMHNQTMTVVTLSEMAA